MDNTKDIIGLVISIGSGVFVILASIFNWDFFFENRKAHIFMKLFGRNGTRVFYALLGCFLFFIAYKIITK